MTEEETNKKKIICYSINSSSHNKRIDIDEKNKPDWRRWIPKNIRHKIVTIRKGGMKHG